MHAWVRTVDWSWPPGRLTPGYCVCFWQGVYSHIWMLFHLPTLTCFQVRECFSEMNLLQQKTGNEWHCLCDKHSCLQLLLIRDRETATHTFLSVSTFLIHSQGFSWYSAIAKNMLRVLGDRSESGAFVNSILIVILLEIILHKDLSRNFQCL